ncbi:MAG: Uma2 family endonuclease, partial [Meiothermus sp.]
MRRATFEEFLELEAKSQTRHEFVDGFVFAMAGGTDYHNRLVTRFLLTIFNAGEEAGCETFAENMLLKVGSAAYYPDVFVTCEEPLVGVSYKKTACLVVEVLSDSTEAIDRGEKLLAYQKPPGLQAYVLVSHPAKRLEIFRRMDDGGWRYEAVEEGAL